MGQPTCAECRFFRVQEEREVDAIGRCRLEKVMGVFRSTREGCRSFSRHGDTHLPPPDTGRRLSRRSASVSSVLNYHVSANTLVELLSTEEPQAVKQAISTALVRRIGLPDGKGHLHAFDLMHLVPADESLKAKEIPYEQLLNKAAMIQDNLRVLEQKVNGEDHVTAIDKIAFQCQLTRCKAAVLNCVSGVNGQDNGLLSALTMDGTWQEMINRPPALGERWHGGRVTYQGQEHRTSETMEAFFHRLAWLRDCLLNLEAMANAQTRVDASTRQSWSNYIRRCYGSLTTFNILFRDRDNYFSSKG
ncbi:MAG: hypothetical protein VX589_00635 [Myxococcota bacterium]|nr:hypothetical protein [Myxococcota bacterium]